jgi:hypothetical protein
MLKVLDSLCPAVPASPDHGDTDLNTRGEAVKQRIRQAGLVAARDIVAFIIVMVGTLIMIRTLHVSTGTLVASVYVTGVFAMWRANSAILRSAGSVNSIGGTAQPDVPPV